MPASFQVTPMGLVAMGVVVRLPEVLETQYQREQTPTPYQERADNTVGEQQSAQDRRLVASSTGRKWECARAGERVRPGPRPAYKFYWKVFGARRLSRSFVRSLARSPRSDESSRMLAGNTTSASALSAPPATCTISNKVTCTWARVHALFRSMRESLPLFGLRSDRTTFCCIPAPPASCDAAQGCVSPLSSCWRLWLPFAGLLCKRHANVKLRLSHSISSIMAALCSHFLEARWAWLAVMRPPNCQGARHTRPKRLS